MMETGNKVVQRQHKGGNDGHCMDGAVRRMDACRRSREAGRMDGCREGKETRRQV